MRRNPSVVTKSLRKFVCFLLCIGFLHTVGRRGRGKKRGKVWAGGAGGGEGRGAITKHNNKKHVRWENMCMLETTGCALL